MQEAKNPSESPRNERLDSPLALEVNDNETIGSRRRGNVRECPCFISSSWADRSESSSRKVWKAGPCMQGRQAGRCDPGMPASSGVITVDTVAGSTAEGLEHVTFEPSGQTGGDSRSVHFRFHTLISPCQLQLYFFTIQPFPSHSPRVWVVATSEYVGPGCPQIARSCEKSGPGRLGPQQPWAGLGLAGDMCRLSILDLSVHLHVSVFMYLMEFR